MLKAFIWDSPVLLYETSSNCDLTTAGEIFGRSGYAIGMPKGSPWSDKISVAILHFHESGIIEQLESAWIEFGNCPQQSSSPTTLGLSHMLGTLRFYKHFWIYAFAHPSNQPRNWRSCPGGQNLLVHSLWRGKSLIFQCKYPNY